ncbi:MAG: Asp-tRNA(Asn)/Glu-tRNA(Gln) amidotransferase subunit GatC [Thermodesulfovibrionales bacterium]
MKIEPSQVQHIARLARLSTTEEERDVFGSQLSAILSYIEKLNELDTSEVEPTSHVIELTNVMRDDSPRPSLDREDVLGNAPDRTDRFYRVPKIIE